VIEGISLEDLLEKTKSYPVPPKLLPQVLEGIRKDYPEGIAAAGADGLRLSLAMLATQGRDVKLAIPRVAGYRAFLNKVWNATRFALMRIGEQDLRPLREMREHLELEDKWILSRLQQVTAKTNENLEAYRFSDAADGIYQFFWTEFCDWYLELIKSRLDENADALSREAARTVVIELLDQSMRLFHPLCPFITEEIWQLLPTKASTWGPQGVEFCAIAPFPAREGDLVDVQAENKMAFLQDIVVALRNAQQESTLPSQKRTPAFVLLETPEQVNFLKKYSDVISRLAITEEPTIGLQGEVELPPVSAVNAGAQFEVAIPLSGLLDIDIEKERLSKELAKIEKDRTSLATRLNNAGFVSKAPSEVIEEHKKQLLELEKRNAKIRASLQRFDKFVL
jgi:valyl-tRNA synthetase